MVMLSPLTCPRWRAGNPHGLLSRRGLVRIAAAVALYAGALVAADDAPLQARVDALMAEC